jgi:hypothetical protein
MSTSYVDRTRAEELNMISSGPDSVRISVDDTMTLHYNRTTSFLSTGRSSVRLSSKAVYNHGLFIIDVEHLPTGCGTWPAFWTLGKITEDMPWPTNGEIDVIEAWNLNTQNTMTLHTTNKSGSCTNSGFYETGTLVTNDCQSDPGGGCSVLDGRTDSAGEGFNANKGGVFAMEWTSAFIRVWFFPRNEIPECIHKGKPDPDEFGPSLTTFELPVANFMAYPNGTCEIDAHFKDHNIIIDTDLCGVLADSESTYGASSCKKYPGTNSTDSCGRFVAENPQAFSEAYWIIHSLKVYQQVGNPPYLGPWPTEQTPPSNPGWFHGVGLGYDAAVHGRPL